KERDIVNTYRGAGATTAAAARRADELDVNQHVAFHRLVQRAVLREAGDGRFYLDEPSWHALRRMRHRMAIVMFVVVIALIVSGVISFRAGVTAVR
ncbi:MAG TPA: hypothetical protein VK636_11480, partial [Gemmatimonadaceae bacterium]|nr:hypothetical protein [Gemmatimonadaceae bacterium]